MKISRRSFLKGSAAFTFHLIAGAGVLIPSRAKAQASSLTLITNVRVFDGKGDNLSAATSVLIDGDKIKQVAPNIEAPSDARRIDGGGRVLMPGLADMHTHLIWNFGPVETINSPLDYLAVRGVQEAQATLMRGFTSIRDIAGGAHGIARAIDEGHFPGPRIQSASAAITMTAGHGDYRSRNIMNQKFGGPTEIAAERIGFVRSADGVPDVLAAARDNFRQGANFIKMFVGGAITGLYDPLDVNEYSPEEIAAAAGEADRWNTYLAVHTYTDRSTRTALEQGARSIEHGNLMTEKTMELLVKKGAWLSTQTGVFLVPLGEGFSDAQKARQKQAADGLNTMMTLAKQYGAKIALGSDMVGSPESKVKHVEEFTARTKWFTNAEILRQATSQNGELWALAGPRNPYPEAKIGVIEPGAFADLLIMDGNPLEDISVMTRPEENLRIIMKGGVTYKNTLDA
jgi:imidazolonepropionase-like amidohydrolase